MTESVLYQDYLRQIAFLCLLLCTMAGCSQNRERTIAEPAPTIAEPDGVQPEACQVSELVRIGSSGGGLDWSPVDNNLLVISDSDENQIKQVYTIHADGSEKNCLTCTAAPGKPAVGVHKGVAHWSPDGRYIFLQVEQEDHSGFRQLAEPGSGMHNDIWATTADGSQWWQLHDISENPQGGVLFPVPSHSGSKLAWAERFAGSDKPVETLFRYALKNPSEDAWGKWRLNIADIVYDDNGPRLDNIQSFTPGNASFYEMQIWSPDDSKILFAATINRDSPHTLDIWEMDLATQELRPITNTDDEWEEHVSYSPDGKRLAYMSSACCEWKPNDWTTLRAELYLMDADGSNQVQLTHFNTPGYPEADGPTVVTKMDWSPDGTRMAIQRQRILSSKVNGRDRETDFWLLTFAGPCGMQ